MTGSKGNLLASLHHKRRSVSPVDLVLMSSDGESAIVMNSDNQHDDQSEV